MFTVRPLALAPVHFCPTLDQGQVFSMLRSGHTPSPLYGVK